MKLTLVSDRIPSSSRSVEVERIGSKTIGETIRKEESSKKKAREVAEMKFQERIDDFERREYEEEIEHREMAKRNRQR